MRLSTRDHDRGAAGLTYVYPVVSRRSRGVSVGINLNPNRACNWRCVYCQVPGLVRGAAPELDLQQLERELVGFLEQVLHGDFMQREVPAGSRRLADVAFSGDGEPTTSKQLREALDTVGRVLGRFELLGRVPIVLISNGSLVHRPEVLAALGRMRELGGTLWFKLDGGTRAARARLNDVDISDERVEENLALAAAACPTRVQSLLLAVDGEPPSQEDQEAYLELLRRVLARGATIVDVMLYGLARPSHQPEAARLSPLPASWLEAFSRRVQELGLAVSVHP